MKKRDESSVPAAPELQVVEVDVKDVLGAREFRMAPGRVTVIEGCNGSGKSSALQAVQAALGRGSLARIARVSDYGAEVTPEVCLVLEGPGQHYRVERTGDQVRVRRRVGDTAALEDVPRPQEFLSGLFDADCANPVRFLTAADKERALLLLEALPLKFDRAQLLSEMGVTPEELLAMGSVPAGLHPLEEIALIRDAVFRARTGVNRDEKQQTASAEQLRRNIPAVPPEDPGGDALAQLQLAVEDLTGAISRETEVAEAAHREAVRTADARYRLEEEKISGSFKAEAAKLRTKHEQKAAEILAEAERRVTEIRAEAQRKVAEELALTDAAIDVLREGGEVAIRDEEGLKARAVAGAASRLEMARTATEERKTELATTREQLATLRAQREGAAKAGALIEQVRQFERQAEQLQGESERLTEAIDALDLHRRRMAEDLPIPGLTIDEKVIRVNGVEFSQLNTAQRVAIAVKVAGLRAQGRRLKVVFVDGAEALDAPHFEALCVELKAAGLQAFVGKVTNDDLRVRVA